MSPFVNVFAGLICIGLAVNFFRMAMFPNAPDPTAIAAVAHGTAKCQPSKDLMSLSKDDLLARCGEPRTINHQNLSGGQILKEQWAYRDPVFYVYLMNDRVESIQYAENGQNFEWKN